MSDQPIRTWTLTERPAHEIRVKPEVECSFNFETLTRVIELEPVLDLLQRVNCNAIFAHDALGRRAATELVSILSEHGRLS